LLKSIIGYEVVCGVDFLVDSRLRHELTGDAQESRVVGQRGPYPTDSIGSPESESKSDVDPTEVALPELAYRSAG
jgi:hypothetical protein